MTSILTEAEKFVSEHSNLPGSKEYWVIEIGNAMLQTSLKVVNELEANFERECGLFEEVTDEDRTEKYQLDNDLEEKYFESEKMNAV
jgi:hypothetical protein